MADRAMKGAGRSGGSVPPLEVSSGISSTDLVTALLVSGVSDSGQRRLRCVVDGGPVLLCN